MNCTRAIVLLFALISLPSVCAEVIHIPVGQQAPEKHDLPRPTRGMNQAAVIEQFGLPESKSTPVIHAASIKPWGEWIPCAWPHDGLQHDKGSGEQLASLYADQGLNTLPERATFEDGGNGVEAGVIEMLDRMQTGRFKVFSHLKEWFDEFRLYHRKDGKIVKERDDLLSATRYALMMKRFADSEPMARPRSQRRGGGWMGA